MDPTDPVALTRALVRCPTVTPDAGPALDLVQEVLGGLGFACHRLPFGAGEAAPADNLYARIGEGRPCLLFAGHVDVVPPGEAAWWSDDPFAGVLRDGRLWGRGAADMKSGVAASLAAAARHLAGGGAPAGSIAFLITGDEEGPARNGTVRVLEWMAERGEAFDGCVVCEPTSVERLGDVMKLGRRGSLNARLTVKGKQGHTAYPQRADNAAHRLVEALQALIAEPIDDGTPWFQPTSLQVASVDVGNPAVNVIPGEARAAINMRFNDGQSRASLEGWLRERIGRHAPNYTLELHGNADAFLTEPNAFTELVADSVEEVVGSRPTGNTTGGTSDARFTVRYGSTVELGLVGTTLHQADEHVTLEDIEGLTRIYEAVLRRFLTPA